MEQTSNQGKGGKDDKKSTNGNRTHSSMSKDQNMSGNNLLKNVESLNSLDRMEPGAIEEKGQQNDIYYGDGEFEVDKDARYTIDQSKKQKKQNKKVHNKNDVMNLLDHQDQTDGSQGPFVNASNKNPQFYGHVESKKDSLPDSQQDNQSVNSKIYKKKKSARKIEESIKLNPGLMQFEMDHSKQLPDLVSSDSAIKKTTPKEIKIQKKLMKKGITRDVFIAKENNEFPPEVFESNGTKSPFSRRPMTFSNKLGKGISDADITGVQYFNTVKRKQLGGLSISEFKKLRNTNKKADNLINHQKFIKELQKISKIKQDGHSSDNDTEEESDDNLHAAFNVEEFNPGSKNQSGNKRVFLNNYGVEQEIPAVYIIDGKVYPKIQTYSIQVVKYVVPNINQKYRTFDIGQKPVDQLSEVIYVDDIYDPNCVVLQLLKRDQGKLEIMKKLPLPNSVLVNILFSPDGKYLSIYSKKRNRLQIYTIDNEDICGLFEKIQKDEYLFKLDNRSEFINAQKMVFDMQNRYLVCHGDHVVNLIALNQTSNHGIDQQIEVQSMSINMTEYKKILDLNFDSTSYEVFKCEVACQSLKHKCISIFDIQEESPLIKRSIYYNNEKLQRLRVKISEDFTSVVLTSIHESYMLRFDPKFGYQQKNLVTLLHKGVGFILSQKSEFFFVCYKEFDKNIDLLCTISETFKLSSPMGIEPNFYNIMDVVQEGTNEQGMGTSLTICSKNGQTFCIDVLQPQAHWIESQMKSLKSFRPIKDDLLPKLTLGRKSTLLFEENYTRSQQYSLNVFRCYKTRWPYVVSTGFDGYLWLYNAYTNIINRIMVPNLLGLQVCSTHISVNDNLYFMLHSNISKTYQLWMIDLCDKDGVNNYDSQEFELKKCFEYTDADVDGRELLDIMVRCESRKDESIQNKRQFVVLLHQGAIYYWWYGQPTIILLDKCFSKVIMKTQLNEFIYVSNEKRENEEYFQINLVRIKFSTYVKNTIYEKANSSAFNIKYFAIDQVSMKLILLLNQRYLGINKKILSVIDLKENNTLISIVMKDKEMIGRFKSGLFSLVDGHFYSGNQVFKIRYDLLHSHSSNTLTEVQLFDKYQDLIDLKMGEVINSGNPLTCMYYHRLVYISRNFKHLKPSRIMILPFLHERKVYVNRTNDSDKYFYNVVDEDVHFHGKKSQCSKGDKQTMIVAINLSDFEYSYYSEKGIFICKVNFQQCVKDFGFPIEVSNDGRIFVFQKPDNIFKLHLICFTTMGPIYMKTINVADDISDYVQSLLDNCKDQQEEDKVKEIETKIRFQYASYMSEENVIIKVGVNNNLDVVVEISCKSEDEVRKELYKIFSKRDVEILQRIAKLQLIKENVYERNFLKFKVEDIEEKINNLYPLLSEDSIRILQRNGDNFTQQIQELMNNSSGQMYYIQKGSVGLQQMHISQRQQSFINVDCDTRDVNLQQLIFANDFSSYFGLDPQPGFFTISHDYVIFWNDNLVFYLMLNDTQVNILTKMKLINMSLDPEYSESFIRHVRAGSDPSLISIVVRQSLQQDCVIIWDLINDVELNSYDTELDPRLFYDQSGKTYYTENDSVVFCDHGVTLSAYDVSKVNQSQRSELYFQYYKGHRFDSRNHNWILFNEYISLSFSFMTFVIRDRDQKAIGHQNEQNFLFDKEQYNFIINRRTCFTCDNFVAMDYEKLQFVLNELKLLDPILLEQLYYFYYEDPAQIKKRNNQKSQKLIQSQFQNKKIAIEPTDKSIEQTDGEYVTNIEKQKRVTPLHLAHREGNNRSINILLKFMSYIKNRNTEAISDILPDLVDYQQFIPYMNSLSFQTIQMKNKQTLKRKRMQTHTIVSLTRSNTSYIDEVYYKAQMGENFEKSSYNCYPVRVSAFKVDWIINQAQGTEFLRAILNSERLEVFESYTVISLIEFLFKHFRHHILMIRLPPYLLQLVNYYAATIINVQFEQSILDGTCSAADKYADCKTLATIQEITAFLNIISTLYTINLVYNSLKASGLQYLESIWAWSDISYIFLNSFINASLIFTNFVSNKTTRVIQAVLSIIIIIKLLYFMQLIDEIAPLVRIILLIFIEIGWFIVIFILIISGFAVSFYLIGKNQMDFVNEMADGDKEDAGEPGYSSIIGSFKHVYLLSLGEFNLDDYAIGNDPYTTSLLWVLFLLSTFLLLIHLLNMLIAIMGETFTHNNEIKSMQQLKSRLQFVLDNLYINPIRKKKKIKYIVTAKIFADEDEECVLSEIKETLDRFVITQAHQGQGMINQMQKVVRQNEQIYNGLK